MLDKNSHFHFIGIGGIGMSGVAKVLRELGYTVSGCDVDMDQKSIRHLQDLGCTIAGTHNSTLCHENSIDAVVHSAAIPVNHPELLHAHRRHIPVVPRARMLAELMRTKHTVAVAGAHGKTTTTAMISHIATHAQQDPSFVIGGFSKNLNTNGHAGTGDFFIAEADESDRSFTYLPVTFAVVTNIDREHLDTYHDLADIVETFKLFLNNLPFYGKAVIGSDDPIVQSMLMPAIPHIKTITYGIEHEAAYRAYNIQLTPEKSSFSVMHQEKEWGDFTLPIAGRYNILNALAALAITHEMGVSVKSAQEALACFQGVERRFCYHGTYKGAQIFDDYAHHPKEIESVLKVARKRAKGKLIVVFQPHRFTRTQLLWNDFVQAFLQGQTDELIITDIFAASEQSIETISSQRLVQELQEKNISGAVHYRALDENFDNIIQKIDECAQPEDLILLLGAGKVFKISDKLVKTKK